MSCMYPCVCLAFGVLRSMGAFLSHSLCYILRQHLSLNLGLPVCSGLPDQKVLGSVSLCLLRTGIIGVSCHI